MAGEGGMERLLGRGGGDCTTTEKAVTAGRFQTTGNEGNMHIPPIKTSVIATYMKLHTINIAYDTSV